MRVPLRLLCAAVVFAAHAAVYAGPDTGTAACDDFLTESQYQRGYDFQQALVITDELFSSEEDCSLLRDFFFQHRSTAGRRFDHGNLAAIVDSVWKVKLEDENDKWVTALLDWLKQIGFEDFSRDIAEFVDANFPEIEILELFFTVLLWIIVIAAVILVLREFNIAGLLRLPGSHRMPTSQMHETATQVARLQDIIGLPLREQMAALLRYSIAVLVAHGKLPLTPGLTNREYLAHLAASSSGEAGLLRSQVELTEPVIYGDTQAREAQLEVCRQASAQLAAMQGSGPRHA